MATKNASNTKKDNTNISHHFLLKPKLQAKTLNDLSGASKKEVKAIKGLVNNALKKNLQAQVGSTDELVVKTLDKTTLNFLDHPDLSVKEIFEIHIQPELQKNNIDKQVLESLKSNLANKGDTKIKELLHLDSSIKDHPLLKQEKQKVVTAAYAKLAKLSKTSMLKLSKEAVKWGYISYETIANWHTAGIITKQEQEALKLTTDLGRLTQNNLGLMEALLKDGLAESASLSTLDHKEWLHCVKTCNTSLPDGVASKEAYAEQLRYTAEMAYPNAYFTHRVISKIPTIETVAIKSAEKLLKNNKNLFSNAHLEIEIIDWKGISTKDKKNLFKDIQDLNALTNTYKYLELSKVLQSNRLTAKKKQDSIIKKLNYLQVYLDTNPQTDIKTANFQKTNKKSKWVGVPKLEQENVRKQFGSFQRVYHLTDVFDVRKKLLASDFDVSQTIVNTKVEIFTKQSGLSTVNAQKVYNKAIDIMATSTNLHELLRNAVVGDFKKLAVANEDPFINAIKDMPSFKDFFGTQDFCKCEHCRSIFSPAAYFTDLMHFIDKEVAASYFDTNRKKHNEQKPNENPLHALDLKARRPDLWDLKFTCANTHDEIAYLELVNEVLGNFVATNEGFTWANSGGLVKNDAFHLISMAREHAIDLPRVLPLEELRLYLSHFEYRLFDVYKTIGASETDIDLEFLQMTADEEKLIATKNLESAHKIFGSKELKAFGGKELKEPIPVKEFLRYAKVSRSELNELLQARFFKNFEEIGIGTSIIEEHVKFKEIIGIKDNRYVDETRPLTKSILDELHRYIRLWKKTELTLSEFDFLMVNLGGNDLTGVSQKLSKWLQIMELLSLKVEELGVFIAGFANENEQFLNRLFNADEIIGKKLEEVSVPLLIRGLGISETELKHISEYLEWGKQIISKADLGHLYQNARLAKGLRMPIGELIGSCKLLNLATKALDVVRINSISHFVNQLEASPFNIADLNFIINGKTSNNHIHEHTYESITVLLANLRESRPGQRASQFPIPNIEEKGKIKAGLLEFMVNEFKMSEQALRTFNADNSFDEKLEKASLVRLELKDELVITTTPDDAHFIDLIGVFQKLQRITFAFQKLGLQKEDVDLITNANARDFWTDTSLTILNWRKLLNKPWSYELIFNFNTYATIIKKADTDDLKRLYRKEILKTQSDKSALTPEHFLVLSEILETSEVLLFSIYNSFSLGHLRLPELTILTQLLELSTTLNIEGKHLKNLKDEGYYKWLGSTNTIKAAFAAKYPTEELLEEKIAPYKDKVSALKRDALCSYILSREDRYKFMDKGDLYHFFLLDSEMSECFKTSKIVAGISSLQLYIHRCLMNLEQSSIDTLKVPPTAIPRNEWEWRKNYRVWEANRKVFLYPENYIEPSLRDTKTHIFKELEDELLQEKVTEESAEAAYKKYLTQFSELTKLRYAGAYHQAMSEDNGLEDSDGKFFLFARTNTDPYEFYYRTFKHYQGKKQWGDWVKMEVAIEAKEISSIIYRGKLYVFWTEVQSKQINKFVLGDSKSKGVQFKLYTKYAFLKEDGTWSVPQRIYLGYTVLKDITIFERIEPEGYVEDKMEDKYEIIVDAFKQEVFRKPYVCVNDDNDLKISHIWTHLKKYYPKYNSETLELLGGHIQISFNFQKEEGNFQKLKSGELTSFRTNVKVLNNQTNKIYDVEVDVRRVSSREGVFKVSGMLSKEITGFTGEHGFDEEIKAQSISNYSNDDLIDGISVSIKTFSLSRNELLNIENIDFQSQSCYYKLISDEAIFLSNEYLNYNFKNLVRYVENGEESFTNVERIFSEDELNDTTSLNGVLLSTYSSNNLSEILFSEGLESFLSLNTQQKPYQFEVFNSEKPYNNYYWELFFHIPFLIANHLNANQKFKEAKWWHERIFNPMSTEKFKKVNGVLNDDDGQPMSGVTITVKGKNLGTITDFHGNYEIEIEIGDVIETQLMGSPNKEIKVDFNNRFWQFIEFRDIKISTIQEMLTNTDAIDAYKEDPFNPHAVARARTNAYQKAIVMKYIDNLIDWGDFLFTQDTRESINEALMLYQLAKDILGDRPSQTGSCETANSELLDYKTIKDKTNTKESSEFWIELENQVITWRNDLASRLVRESLTPTSRIPEGISKATPITSKLSSGSNTAVETTVTKVPVDYKRPNLAYPSFNIPLQSKLAFCIPENKNLIAYWDRVDDRLFKIRHCLNIRGVRRSLSLFQPPIDPALLVRAKAVGLSMEDVLALVSGLDEQPLYRFDVLLNKAKGFVQTVQSFGGALLGALEKKDAEELTLIRSVHEQNIFKLTRRVKQQQLKEVKYNYKSSQEAFKNVQNRINYYENLIDTGLIPWETTQQVTKHTATGFKISESIPHLMAGIAYLVPQLGSPFAMKYGGKELGDSGTEFAQWAGALASIMDSVSASAGLEASWQRRDEEWNQQRKVAKQELKQLDQQVLAAEIRVDLAEKDIEIHENNIEQAKELYSFYKGKFTSLSLYNFMSTTLSRLYRQAYNMALEMAQEAEKAYRFESDDDDALFIEQNNWDSSKAGLLAGEQLLMQLQQMEQAHIKSNVRKPEITQTFSLTMIDPQQLIQLRQSGKCTLIIPEILFDMHYPGQYKRLIKTVRLSIPAVVGPYTNVSAKLTYVKGEIRKDVKQAETTDYKFTGNKSINTSSGVNDSGMFELNFRDERYLPFEGAGAVNSKWQIDLPSTVRPFNYDTISDILFTISYTAKEGDSTYREKIEEDLKKTLTGYALTSGLFRLISLKYEFPSTFHQLLNSADNEIQKSSFELSESHYPYFLKGEGLIPMDVYVYLKPKSGTEVSKPKSLELNDKSVSDWKLDTSTNAVDGNEKVEALQKGILKDIGTLNAIGIWTITAKGLEKEVLDDILVLLKYKTK